MKKYTHLLITQYKKYGLLIKSVMYITNPQHLWRVMNQKLSHNIYRCYSTCIAILVASSSSIPEIQIVMAESLEVKRSHASRDTFGP